MLPKIVIIALNKNFSIVLHRIAILPAERCSAMFRWLIKEVATRSAMRFKLQKKSGFDLGYRFDRNAATMRTHNLF